MRNLPEIRSLTGLRGFAALWVVAFHSFEHSGFYGPLDYIAAAGYLGVDVFFVLSGFVLALKYADSPMSYNDFLLKRFARIYPAYLFVLVMMCGLVILQKSGNLEIVEKDYTFAGLIASLLMIQAWIPHLQFSWNLPSWSVSAEWSAYLAFPILVAAVKKIRHEREVVLLILVCFSALYIIRAVITGYFDVVSVAARLFAEFVGGVLAYQLLSIGVRPRRADLMAGICLIGLFVGGNLIQVYFGASADIFPIASVGLVYWLASAEGPVSRFFGSPIMVYLGRVSYALYLTHWTWLVLSESLNLRIPGARWPFRIAAIAGAVASASLIYRYVEEPARRWLTRRIAQPSFTNVEATPA
jgi:peptidoglycan/LPS O-acetylase OafA/YrhL